MVENKPEYTFSIANNVQILISKQTTGVGFLIDKLDSRQGSPLLQLNGYIAHHLFNIWLRYQDARARKQINTI